MPIVVPKNTEGYKYNQFELLTVADTVFPEFAQFGIHIPFQRGLLLINYGPGIAEYSFDGISVHGDMRPGTPSEKLNFSVVRVFSGIWFQSAGSPEIRIEAWSGT